MRQNIRLGTFYGIAVGVNWSVVVILALFAWDLADYVLPTRSGHPDTADWIAGVIGAVVLLASLLAHEVSHALVARHNGVGVRSITLFVFGGIARLEGEAHTPGADFRIAAVGPATSILLAAVFVAAQLVLVAAGGHGLPVDVLSWLWEINLLLAAFNLIPAAPLDGGRILRAGLWRHWDDRTRASVTAARAGRGFAIVLIALGFIDSLYVGIVGLWPALIGLFLYSAARAEEQYALARGALANLSVGEVMTPHPPTVPNRTIVADLASYLWHYRGDAVAVTDDNGWLAGVVTAQAVSAVPLERRHGTTLAEIAIALTELPVARPEGSMSELLERIASSGGHPALVLDTNNRLVGIVTPADVQRAAAFNMGRQPQSTRRW
jgi:Zn-dependent protease